MATADQLELGMDLLHVLRFWSPSGVCFTKDVFVTDFVLSDKDVGVFANRFIADGLLLCFWELNVHERRTRYSCMHSVDMQMAECICFRRLLLRRAIPSRSA